MSNLAPKPLSGQACCTVCPTSPPVARAPAPAPAHSAPVRAVAAAADGDFKHWLLLPFQISSGCVIASRLAYCGALATVPSTCSLLSCDCNDPKYRICTRIYSTVASESAGQQRHLHLHNRTSLTRSAVCQQPNAACVRLSLSPLCSVAGRPASAATCFAHSVAALTPVPDTCCDSVVAAAVLVLHSYFLSVALKHQSCHANARTNLLESYSTPNYG